LIAGPGPADVAATPAASRVLEGLPPRRKSRVPRWVSGPLRRFENYVFPARAPDRPNPSGRLAGWPSEPYALIMALALAGVFAVLLENSTTAFPVPPGGDPGEWITTSYAFVGLPYPSWIIPGQYPPLLFPLLGLLVRIGGGAINGGRLYLGLVAILVGGSTYFLARSLVRSPVLAILAEGLILFNPSFMQLFYFGAYPNLLGLVFLNLAVAFAVRLLRSERSLHAFLFWVFFAATILTHSLVGVVLIATVLFMGAFLLWFRRVPRALYRSPGGLAGIGVFAAGVGGFYLATRFLGIPHPNYLQSSGFAYVKNGLGQIFYLLLNPYFPGVRPSVSIALPLLALATGVIVLFMVGLRLFQPQRLTLSLLTVLSMVVAVTALCVVGWELSIVTDYVRLGYFLVTPAVFLLMLVADWIIIQFRVRGLREAVRGDRPALTADAPTGPDRAQLPEGTGAALSRVPPSSASVMSVAPVGDSIYSGRSSSGRRKKSRGSPGLAGSVAVCALLAALLLFVADTYAIPAFSRDEVNNTQTGHDQAFLAAIRAIQHTGISGTVLTVPGAAKWTRALLAENAYAPILPERYTFDPSHIYVEELAYFAATDRFAVTNGNVAESVLGFNASFANQSPMYQAADFGVFSPILTMPATNMSVTVLVAHKGYTTTNLTMSPTIYAPLAGSPESMALVYRGPGFVLNLTLGTVPGSTHGFASVQAVATAGSSLAYLNATLLNPPNGTTHFGVSPVHNELVAVPAQNGGQLTTFANVTPASAIPTRGGLVRYNHLGVPAQAFISVAASVPKQGSPTLNFSVAYSTPGSSNFLYTLPPLISTVQLWGSWNVRFVLYANASTPLQARANFLYDEVPYIEGEFGARVYAESGPWTVLLIPPPTQTQ
jgi:hypothetical protein